MDERFQAAVGVVREHLEANNYSYSIKMNYLRCYRLIEVYLEETGEPYSNVMAEQWLQGIAQQLCRSSFNVYRLAIEKLRTAYHHREIGIARTRYSIQNKYTRLAPWCQHMLDGFMEEILGESYTPSYLGAIRSSVAQFLNYLDNRRVPSAESITHRIVTDYYRDDDHHNYKVKDVRNNSIRKFLHYLAKRGDIYMSVPFVLDKFVLSRLIFIDSLPNEGQWRFSKNICKTSITAEQYYRVALELGESLEQYRYSKTVRNVFRKAWKELFVFLEANSLGYSKEMAITWAEYMGQYTVQWSSFRRAIMLFEQYRTNGLISPWVVYSYLPDRAKGLPAWCKEDYEAFMRSKSLDGFAKSTLDMYRNSCLRLLFYLDTAGIDSWAGLSPEMLKKYYLQDHHSTTGGKNAYSYKIRIFLEYLGELGRVPPTLFMAMPSESAPKTGIVQTLGDGDIASLYQSRYFSCDAYNLRGAAMVLLGLRMGLRASDITKLRFADISWGQRTLSVQQQKTGRFLKLPMPVEVGNALYRYIVEGRPSSSTDYVFTTHRVPYHRLSRGACRRALSKVLPDNKHGFRITRKTFASRMLVMGVPYGIISETLGHANDSSVMTYLSTNDEKMRLCALPLSMVPVKGGILA